MCRNTSSIFTSPTYLRSTTMRVGLGTFLLPLFFFSFMQFLPSIKKGQLQTLVCKLPFRCYNDCSFLLIFALSPICLSDDFTFSLFAIVSLISQLLANLVPIKSRLCGKSDTAITSRGFFLRMSQNRLTARLPVSYSFEYSGCWIINFFNSHSSLFILHSSFKKSQLQNWLVNCPHTVILSVHFSFASALCFFASALLLSSRHTSFCYAL